MLVVHELFVTEAHGVVENDHRATPLAEAQVRRGCNDQVPAAQHHGQVPHVAVIGLDPDVHGTFRRRDQLCGGMAELHRWCGPLELVQLLKGVLVHGLLHRLYPVTGEVRVAVFV